ncbi:MAG: hypothetical protein MZU97_09815 [Bacillus subtilis]|nr:hypothetical protein [Bacillus subtilis]
MLLLAHQLPIKEDNSDMPPQRSAALSKEKMVDGCGPLQSKRGESKSVYALEELEIIAKVNQAVKDRDTSESDIITSKRMTMSVWINVWFIEYQQSKSRSRELKSSSIENVYYTLVKSIEHHRIGKKQM